MCGRPLAHLNTRATIVRLQRSNWVAWLETAPAAVDISRAEPWRAPSSRWSHPPPPRHPPQMADIHLHNPVHRSTPSRISIDTFLLKQLSSITRPTFLSSLRPLRCPSMPGRPLLSQYSQRLLSP